MINLNKEIIWKIGKIITRAPGGGAGKARGPGRARGPCEFSLRRDPSSASRPYPGSPFWGLVLWAGRPPETKGRLPVAA